MMQTANTAARVSRDNAPGTPSHSHHAAPPGASGQKLKAPNPATSQRNSAQTYRVALLMSKV